MLQLPHRTRAVALGRPLFIAALGLAAGLAHAAEPEGSSEVELEEATLQASESVETYGGFSTTEASSLGLGIGMELEEVPASISVLADEFLDISQSDRLRDVLTYIPGVNVNDDGGWTTDGILIRGFPAGRQLYIDGLKQEPLSIRPHFATIDRIEVLKGAASADFGVAEPGGVINVIRKKPFEGSLYELDLSIGTYGHRDATIDINESFLEDDSLQARLVASYGESAEWRKGREDNDNIYDYVIAPSLKWEYSDTGSITARYERVYQADPQDRGIIYLEGAFSGGFAPRDWSWHQNSGEQVNEIHRYTFELDQEITDALEFRGIYSYTDYGYYVEEYRNAESEGNGPLYNPDGVSWSGATTFDASYAAWYADSDTHNVKLELDYDFSIGSVENNLVVGTRYFETDNDGEFYDTSPNGNTTVDLFDPDPDGLTEDVDLLPDPFVGGTSIYETGYFAKLQSDITPRFRTLLSAQYVEFEGDNFGSFSESDDLSIRVAASFDVTENNTLFAGYSDAYMPQVGVTRGGSQVDPTHDQSYEIGVKTTLFGGRALWTNSVFHTNRSDLVASDPTNDPGATPPESFVVNFGEVEITGFESEFVGSVNEQLDLRLGFALMDSEIVKAETGDFEGNEFANTADLQVTGFADYDLDLLGLPEVTASAGFIHISDRPGNSGNNITLPSYTTVDAGLRWRINEHMEVYAYASNIFDEEVILSMQDSGDRADQVDVGDHRLFRVGMTFSY